MDGNNKLHMCKSAMMVAVQQYLDSITKGREWKVVDVSMDSSNAFLVSLTEPSREDDR